MTIPAVSEKIEVSVSVDITRHVYRKIEKDIAMRLISDAEAESMEQGDAFVAATLLHRLRLLAQMK